MQTKFKTTISVDDLKRIVNEELSSLTEASKTQSIHAAKAAVSSAASKLLDAIAAFREEATSAATHAVTPHLAGLEKSLEHMTDTPGAYIEKQKIEPKKVSLRAVSAEGKITKR